MSEKFLSSGKAAEYLGISLSTLYRMEKNKELTVTKTQGGQRRFAVVSLDDYLQRNTISEGNKSSPNKSNSNTESSIAPDETNSLPPVIKDNEAETDISKPVDPRNSLNDLNGTQWLPLTKSFLYQKGLGAKHPHAQIERQHPAPYSFQDISQLILFFTKQGMKVLDPFGGVGSTAKACALEHRICTSIELQKNWNELAIQRLEEEVKIGSSKEHTFLQGNSIDILPTLPTESFDFMVTSPPYWSILNKKADHKVNKERVANNLATSYSEKTDSNDLANIEDYDEFLNIITDKVFLECARVLKTKKYMCLVVSDFRHKSDFISFHSDLIQKLNKRNTSDGKILKLQGVKILIQNHKSLLPYGYPYAYVENIHHQYIIIFRKEAK